MPRSDIRAILVTGLLLFASCARKELPPSALVQAAHPVVDAGVVTAQANDRDNDGVADEVDRCPDDPEDCDGFEDADGCPDEDNDHDGVPDYCDSCPNLAVRTANGCPLVIARPEEIKITPTVTFEVNGVKPTFEHDVFDLIVGFAKQDRLKRIGIVGRALPKEKDAARLAARRADAIKKLLVERGVPAIKIELRTAHIGDLEGCPPSADAGPPGPCVSLFAAELDERRLTWDGSRYVTPPEPPRFICPPPPPKAAGQPCGAR